MSSQDKVFRTADASTESASTQGQNDQHQPISLASVVRDQSDYRIGAVRTSASASSNDQYIFFGDPETAGSQSGQDTNAGTGSGRGAADRSGSGRGRESGNIDDAKTEPTVDTTNPTVNVERTSVTLNSGDTFWKLAAEKYDGKEPIEAIFAANGLKPKVTQEPDGSIKMEDPTYFAGKTYALPATSEIADLTKQYRQQVEEMGRYGKERVGDNDKSTDVKLIYGDTLWALADAKYDGKHPMAAVYEANGMTPQLTQSDGKQQLESPPYFAGKTYTMPAESDIPTLERKFWDRIGHPELCPQEYRSDNSTSASGNDTGSVSDRSQGTTRSDDAGNGGSSGFRNGDGRDGSGSGGSGSGGTGRADNTGGSDYYGFDGGIQNSANPDTGSGAGRFRPSPQVYLADASDIQALGNKVMYAPDGTPITLTDRANVAYRGDGSVIQLDGGSTTPQSDAANPYAQNNTHSAYDPASATDSGTNAADNQQLAYDYQTQQDQNTG